MVAPFGPKGKEDEKGEGSDRVGAIIFDKLGKVNGWMYHTTHCADRGPQQYFLLHTNGH